MQSQMGAPSGDRTEALCKVSEPVLAKRGRNKRFSEEERIRILWSRVEITHTCWLYRGKLNPTAGYAHVNWSDSARWVHRIFYEWQFGPIPKGLQIDHLCRVRHCVNPWHMEAVTPRVNTFRGKSVSVVNAAKTHCPHGHEYNEKNTFRDSVGQRHCRICGMLNARRYRKLRPGRRGKKVAKVEGASK